MKYNLLLKFLRILMYIKRFFWWIGSSLFFVLGIIFQPVWRLLAWINYKIEYFLKRHGLSQPDNWILQRRNLQFLIFLVLLFLVLPQSVLFKKQDAFAVGRNTIAYALAGPGEEDYSLEEVVAEPPLSEQHAPSWKEGVVSTNIYAVPQRVGILAQQDLSAIAPGGLAVNKPYIMPGATVGGLRSQPEQYVVEPGDSLSSIAYEFGVSVATVMWANNLGAHSLLHPGDHLKILPTSGVTHKVKKGDNLKRIANLYGAKVEDIVKFNNLKEDGTDLVAGEEVMIPGGIMPQQIAGVSRPTVGRRPIITEENPYVGSVAVPPGSSQIAGLSGFVWPSAAKAVTQYYNWQHHAMDIAGPMGTSNYAAKAGTVIKSQCGWNGGYGCYVMIDHGGGVITVYGHNSRLLVSVGDYVETGQTIALMGNTGNVRGITGVHLHFEVRINSRCVNPLGYIR